MRAVESSGVQGAKSGNLAGAEGGDLGCGENGKFCGRQACYLCRGQGRDLVGRQFGDLGRTKQAQIGKVV